MTAKAKETESNQEPKALVRALKTPVNVPNGILAKGGQATIDLKTAEHKEKKGDVEIIKIL